MTVRVGVIGMSFGADFHIPAFERLAGVEVTALADGGSGKAFEIAKSISSAPKVFASASDLATSPEIDVVTIATPPQEHACLVNKALETGKNVLCEKPFGLTVEGAQNMVALANQKNAKTAIGLEMRFDRGIAKLAHGVRSGRIGKVENISVQWLGAGGANPKRLYSWRDDIALGAGVVGEFGSHIFDYAPWIMQSSICFLSAHTENIVKQRPDLNGEMKMSTTPDKFELKCTFDNGASGHFLVSNACPGGDGHRIKVSGDKGCISLHLYPPFRERDIDISYTNHEGQSVQVRLPDPFTTLDEDTRRGAFNALVEAFMDDNYIEIPDFEAGLNVQRCIAAVHQSSENGIKIKL